MIPAASLQIYLGGVDTAGGLSFAITWPPTSFAEGVPYFPDGGPTAVDGGVIPDTAVVYFNCAIPGAMETCADGVKNGFETDIDCGGPHEALDGELRLVPRPLRGRPAVPLRRRLRPVGIGAARVHHQPDERRAPVRGA